MGKIDRIFISVIIFSLAITAGVISQAGQSIDSTAASVARSNDIADVELVEARYREVDSASEAKTTTSKPQKNLYPTTLWVLGSALLAMVGYKRMRNTSSD